MSVNPTPGSPQDEEAIDREIASNARSNESDDQDGHENTAESNATDAAKPKQESVAGTLGGVLITLAVLAVAGAAIGDKGSSRPKGGVNTPKVSANRPGAPIRVKGRGVGMSRIVSTLFRAWMNGGIDADQHHPLTVGEQQELLRRRAEAARQLGGGASSERPALSPDGRPIQEHWRYHRFQPSTSGPYAQSLLPRLNSFSASDAAQSAAHIAAIPIAVSVNGVGGIAGAVPDYPKYCDFGEPSERPPLVTSIPPLPPHRHQRLSPGQGPWVQSAVPGAYETHRYKRVSPGQGPLLGPAPPAAAPVPNPAHGLAPSANSTLNQVPGSVEQTAPAAATPSPASPKELPPAIGRSGDY